MSNSNLNDDHKGQGQDVSQPLFNLPHIIVISVLLLVGIHLLRSFLFSAREDDLWLLLNFGFLPARFDEQFMTVYGDVFLLGSMGKAGSFLTYGFLHGDWTHLILNAVWLVVFGSALARRFGTIRFLLISVLGSVVGAVLHLLVNWGEVTPMVGASAAISAHMAATARFAFVPYGPLGVPRSDHPGAYFLPALTLLQVFQVRQVLVFLGIFFAINLIIGGAGGFIDEASAIAWEAHLGSFLAGLFLFPLFDPVRDR